MDWRWPCVVTRFGALAALVGALACPAAAGAEMQLADVKAEAGGNGVRITAKIVGTQPINELFVSGNYQADIQSFSAHPPGNCRHFNESAQQPAFGCEFGPPGVAPGIRFLVDLINTGPCPPGRAFLVQVENKSTGSNSSTVAPCTQSSGADLGLTLSPARQAFIFSSSGPGSRIVVEDPGDDEETLVLRGLSAQFVNATVTNHGPGTAEASELAVSGTPGLPDRATYGLSDARNQPGVRCGQVACELGNLASGDSRVISLRVDHSRGGRIAVPLLAFSSTHDPGPRPNKANYIEDVRNGPDSEVKRVGALAIHGDGESATQVRVAVVRTAGGASVVNEGEFAGGSAASCNWLRSTKVRFKRQRGRRCSKPVWLKAKGARRWRLKFKKRLPPGRYVVISSAARGKAAESTFSKRDGNRRTFTVKRGRR